MVWSDIRLVKAKFQEQIPRKPDQKIDNRRGLNSAMNHSRSCVLHLLQAVPLK